MMHRIHHHDADDTAPSYCKHMHAYALQRSAMRRLRKVVMQPHLTVAGVD